MKNMTQNHKKNEHGTMTSYVVGFLLSLIFTFIPYYLVVNEKISGTQLLKTIVGFAMLQMLVQITFFLHIGRGPKPRWNLYFFIATAGIIMVVVGGSIFIINNLHYNMSPSDQTRKLVNDESIYQIGGEKTGACKGQYTNHQITITDAQVVPFHTDANKCDTLTFINEDNQVREIAFGEHPNHEVYAGETELILLKSRSKTITLSESGTINFHDHLEEEVNGNFSVNP